MKGWPLISSRIEYFRKSFFLKKVRNNKHAKVNTKTFVA